MARKPYPEDESVPAGEAAARGSGEPRGRVRAIAAGGEELDYAPGLPDSLNHRPLDLEPEPESPFLRAQKRVPVRRGPLPKKAANRLKFALAALAAIAVVAGIEAGISGYARRSWRFRLDSSDQIELTDNRHVSRSRVLNVFGGDISRNLFLVPLEERKRQLEQVPWIESATVMRLLPNRIRVDVRERTPVGFVQVGRRIALVDRNGVIMDVPAGTRQSYSFPVITGMSEAEPLSTRAARMKVYSQVMNELDSGGGNYSRDISEIDLRDPEDVKITAANPQGDVLIHLGSGDFLRRYGIYVAHAQEWRQQFERLDSVDLRYDRQVIVNPDAGPRAASARRPAAVTSSQAAAAGAQKPAPPRPANARHGKKPATVRHRR